MAGEYDEKFEELTTLVLRLTGGMDELRMEMRDRRSEGLILRTGLNEVRTELQTGLDAVRTELHNLGGQLTKNTVRLTSVEEKLSILSNQFNDVAVMAIKDNKRIENLENRVGALETGVH